LADIGPMFAGLNYKHTLSTGGCCIINSTHLEDYSMKVHCCTNGPFTADDVWRSGECFTVTQKPGQLTLCGTP
jgi:hypothetical protein